MFQNNDVEHGRPLVPSLPPTPRGTVEGPGSDRVMNGVVTMEAMEEGESVVNGKDEENCGVPVDRLSVFDAEDIGMEGLFTVACERILEESSVKYSPT